MLGFRLIVDNNNKKLNEDLLKELNSWVNEYYGDLEETLPKIGTIYIEFNKTVSYYKILDYTISNRDELLIKLLEINLIKDELDSLSIFNIQLDRFFDYLSSGTIVKFGESFPDVIKNKLNELL